MYFIPLLFTGKSLNVPVDICVPTDRIFGDISVATVSDFIVSVWHPTSTPIDVLRDSWVMDLAEMLTVTNDNV